MNKYSKLVALMLSGFVLASCSNDSTAENSNEEPTQAVEAESTENTEVAESETTDSEAADTEADVPTEDNPMIVDEEAGEVKLYATMNPQYKEESTMHMVVAESGQNKDSAMFVAYANQNDFHKALEQIGATPGDNVNMDNAGTVAVEGTPIEMNFNFEDSDEVLTESDIIVDGSGKDVEMRFGGNFDAAEELNTGCISCLESCPAGIISNAAHMLGEDSDASYTLNESLPEDESLVITYSIKSENCH